MDGIVSLLDEQHQEQVEAIWEGLRREFGLRGIYPSRFPHFSYHVAEAYDPPAMQRILAEFAAQRNRFQARTTGLGIFTVAQPIVFIPVVRTPELTLLHQELWLATAGASGGTVDLYHPHKWVPHITLAHGDLSHEMLPDVVRYLAKGSYTWEITVGAIVLLIDAGMPNEQRIKFTLGN